MALPANSQRATGSNPLKSSPRHVVEDKLCAHPRISHRALRTEKCCTLSVLTCPLFLHARTISLTLPVSLRCTSMWPGQHVLASAWHCLISVLCLCSTIPSSRIPDKKILSGFNEFNLVRVLFFPETVLGYCQSFRHQLVFSSHAALHSQSLLNMSPALGPQRSTLA